MIRVICILLVSVYLISCEEDIKELPFSEEKTVRILSDMFIIEAVLSVESNDEKDSIRAHYQQILFKDYKIDSIDLVKLREYLESNPEHSQELHDQARNRIDHLQRTMN